MLKERDRVIKSALLALDALIISLSFFLTFILRQHLHFIYKLNLLPSIYVFKSTNLSVGDYLSVYFFLLMLWCMMLFSNGMYRSLHTKSLLEVIWIIIKSVLGVTITFSVIVFLLKLKFVSRLFFVIFMGLTSIFLVSEKQIFFSIMRMFLKRGYNLKKILIVGTGKRPTHIIDTIKSHPEWGIQVVKVVDYAECLLDEGKAIRGCEVIETEEDMRRILHSRPIDEVIFAVPRSRLDIVEKFIYVCEDEGVDAAIAADFFNFKVSQLRHTDLDGIPLITLEKTFDKEWQLFIKRSIDIVVSGLGIIVLSPFFLIVIILIRLTSPGPAIFLQKRVSLHGRKFTLYKFRSMYKGAEKELASLAYLNEVEGPIFKIKNDPRITPVGRFLRRYSLDELLQLFNVFMGKMSLVGPRPALPREVGKYETWQRRRLSLRPGITCLWQVYHRGENDFEKWMQSDLDYVDNWSLWLDFKILIMTLLAVLSGKGAY